MQKLLLLLLILCNAFGAWAQLSITLTAVPANTPANANIYIVGNFNNWDAADPNYILTPQGNGQYSITINPSPGALEFKFTRGGWNTVEGNASGAYLPNRTYTYSGQPSNLNLTIASWEDLGVGGGGGNSTAAANVYILSNNFYIPQLDRTRRIWVYLPPDYASSGKNYPVLYMHDAQNLFDAATSFSGEWEVDESLNLLFQQGDYGCIVVGIDNGGTHRLDEYSPWVNTQYGGGEGELYVDFMVNTLKPHIDSLYRTLPGRQATGIMGSSMGGLISMYALSERQDVFSKAGIFSPAFWFAGNEPANHVASSTKEGDVRVYFLAGGDEPLMLHRIWRRFPTPCLPQALHPVNNLVWCHPMDNTPSGSGAGNFLQPMSGCLPMPFPAPKMPKNWRP
ncbi:MAG: alpha/beta hydrolase [Lewinellaceae bacterium]|nr:alpha/beta hydrolase [Lewinellaceae bacterium]